MPDPDATLDVDAQRAFVNWVRLWWGDSYGHSMAPAGNDGVVRDDFEDMTEQLAERGLRVVALTPATPAPDPETALREAIRSIEPLLDNLLTTDGGS